MPKSKPRMSCKTGFCRTMMESMVKMPKLSDVGTDYLQLVLHEQFCEKKAIEREAEASAKLTERK